MDIEKLNFIKKKIFVYHIVPLDSTGIYIAENKDDAISGICKELWDNVDWENMFKASTSGRFTPINIFNAVEIWNWEEYQGQQGFKVSERLLEIVN